MASVNVRGMHCENCRKAVKQAVSKVPGVASVEVSLEEGRAVWTDADAAAPVAAASVVAAIQKIGFDVEA